MSGDSKDPANCLVAKLDLGEGRRDMGSRAATQGTLDYGAEHTARQARRTPQPPTSQNPRNPLRIEDRARMKRSEGPNLGEASGAGHHFLCHYYYYYDYYYYYY